MDPEKKLMDKLHENALSAADIMGKYLNGEIHGSDKIREASLTITQYFKLRATKGVENSLKLAIIKMVAKNKEDLQEMIKGGLPDYNPQIALSEGKE